MAYLAVAPAVLAKDQAGRIHYHYADVNPVIPWLSDEQAAHFLSEGLVVNLEDGAPAPVAAPAASPAGGQSVLPEPLKTAPEADWQAFAVSKGANPDEAAKTAKADLIALYGSA